MVFAVAAFLDNKPFVHICCFLLVAVGLTLGSVSTAFATKPADKFEGDIIISKKRFPSRFKSDSHFINFMEDVETHELTAKGDDDWKFQYMAFLPKPVAVLEATVTYYDITNPGEKKYVNTFKFYPADREKRVLAGHASLSPDKFSRNKKYLMVFSRGYGQTPLAKTKFVLRRKGVEKKKNSGAVDFTGGKKDKKK